MLLAAIFLSISVAALVVMIFYRVWEIRVGRLAVRDEDLPEKIFSIDDTEERVSAILKKTNIFTYHFFALLLSHFFVFLKNTSRSAKAEWKKFSERLPNHVSNRSPGSSFFLKDISAHKEEVRKENGYHSE